MCARYQTPSQAAAERYWQVVEPLWHFEPSWRVLPTQQIPIVLALNGVITGRMMRWGLIPYSGSTSYPLINATVEKLATWYGWRYPWAHGRRCVFAMSGFYEPHVVEGGRKEPYYVHVRDRPIFGVAGIWERKKSEDGTEGLSCALITVPANELLAQVHNEKLRMPAVLREDDHAVWLTGRPEEAMQALEPYPSDGMEAWQVSRRLYANKAPDDEGLIERVGQ